MNWLTFLAASLAVFRVTRLITDDKITSVFRREVKKGGKEVGYLVQCPFCASFYVTVGFGVFLVWSGMMKESEALVWGSAIWGLSNIWNQVFVWLSVKR